MEEKEEIKQFRTQKIKELEGNEEEFAQYFREQLIKKERGEPVIETQLDEKELDKILKQNFYEIKDILEYYMDMKEEYYTLVSLWILGTYLHKQFYTYPYLFFNAMRGSGKSRIVELITELSCDGIYTKSPTEAVLFRTSGTLGIDEFERVSTKDKAGVREILNAAYKKGVKVMRMKKKKVLGNEEQVVETFDSYRPVVMANIWGMEEVLGDRCINLVLEKSNDDIKTRLVQDYDTNQLIQNIKKSVKKCSLCSVVSKKNIYTTWNNYIFSKNKTTLTTYNTPTTLTTQTTQDKIEQIKLDKLFNKIYDSGIKGRNLELFLPIFFVAFLIEEDVLNQSISIAKSITSQKQHEEETESIDISVYDFISKINGDLEYHAVKELTAKFRNFIDEDYEWVNTKWFGRALKRLNLVMEKRRRTKGVEVLLNVNKARDKIGMFKTETFK